MHGTNHLESTGTYHLFLGIIQTLRGLLWINHSAPANVSRSRKRLNWKASRSFQMQIINCQVTGVQLWFLLDVAGRQRVERDATVAWHYPLDLLTGKSVKNEIGHSVIFLSKKKGALLPASGLHPTVPQPKLDGRGKPWWEHGRRCWRRHQGRRSPTCCHRIQLWHTKCGHNLTATNLYPTRPPPLIIGSVDLECFRE